MTSDYRSTEAPVFPKVETPIKRTIAEWLVKKYKTRAGKPGDITRDGNFYFTYGELWEAIGNVPQSTIQPHVGNLKREGYISALDVPITVTSKTGYTKELPFKDRLAWISRDQCDALTKVVANWDRAGHGRTLQRQR